MQVGPRAQRRAAQSRLEYSRTIQQFHGRLQAAGVTSFESWGPDHDEVSRQQYLNTQPTYIHAQICACTRAPTHMHPQMSEDAHACMCACVGGERPHHTSLHSHACHTPPHAGRTPSSDMLFVHGFALEEAQPGLDYVLIQTLGGQLQRSISVQQIPHERNTYFLPQKHPALESPVVQRSDFEPNT